MKLNNTIYHLILILVPSLVLSGCLGTEYYDVATDEIITPEGITNVIPQEGAALEIELTYEFEYYTKFEPGRRFKQYRYKVYINDRPYCYGVTADESQRVTIPIMENDSHTPATIVVEGAKALDYNVNPEQWDTWHELYRGTQECLPESESLKYPDFEDWRLIVRIDGKDYPFVLYDTGAGEVLKRHLFGRKVSIPISLNDNYIYPSVDDGFVKELNGIIPPNFGAANERQKAGNLYISPYGELHICLHNHTITGYDSDIGFCDVDYKDDLKKLYPGWHGYVQSEMTLFLVEPTNQQ